MQAQYYSKIIQATMEALNWQEEQPATPFLRRQAV